MLDYPQIPKIISKSLHLKLWRGNLFHGALEREFASRGLSIFVILLGIVVFTQLVRLLGESVSGTLAVDSVLTLLGFGALNYLPTLLSLSLFLSVLLTLTRAYRENEMVVWFSCGMGLTRWVRPVMYYALPIVCLIGLLSLVLSPWAMSKVDELKRRLDNRDDLTIASPGTFRESRPSDRVFLIESVDTKKNQIGTIFIQTMRNGRLGTLVAKHGVQEVAPNGDRFLVLLNGTRYDGTPGRLDFKIIEFERYSLRIKEAEARQRPTPLDSLSTPQLLKNSGSWNVSELERRLSLPLGALILSILAIPLSFVNPRTGRSFNLIMALAIYMVYNNLMGVITALVGQSKIDPIFAFFGIHMLMAALIAALFYYRLSVFSLWRLKR